MKNENKISLGLTLFLEFLVLIFSPISAFATPPDSAYLPGETLGPTCSPSSAFCTVKTFISGIGSPNQVLMVNSSGTDLEYRTPDTSMLSENSNLYFTSNRVNEHINTLMNIASGIAGLDSSGKIPLSLLPDSVLGSASYKGSWDASANLPALADRTGSK